MPFKMKQFEFNDCKFYVGQSAKENWELLDKAKVENQNYIWFHLNSFPSPYVIMWSSIDELIKSENVDTSENLSVDKFLNFGAELCKKYSKYKNYKDLKIMYITVKKLTKTETIGEVNITGKSQIIKL